MKSYAVALSLVFGAGVAQADGFAYVSSFGDKYTASRNADGGILTSHYPKAWFVEGGASSYVEEGIDKIYFGKSCDAFHKVFGKGTFGWANGGFVVEFASGTRIGFPRQELPWDELLHCTL